MLTEPIDEELLQKSFDEMGADDTLKADVRKFLQGDPSVILEPVVYNPETGLQICSSSPRIGNIARLAQCYLKNLSGVQIAINPLVPEKAHTDKAVPTQPPGIHEGFEKFLAEKTVSLSMEDTEQVVRSARATFYGSHFERLYPEEDATESECRQGEIVRTLSFRVTLENVRRAASLYEEFKETHPNSIGAYRTVFQEAPPPSSR